MASSIMQASAPRSDKTKEGNASGRIELATAAQKGEDIQMATGTTSTESTPQSTSTKATDTSSSSNTRVGHTCNDCNEFSLTLFRGNGGKLVCKKCRGRSRQKNVITVVKM